MSTQHTPGPWEAYGKAVHATSGREILFGAHNTRSGSEAEQRANARLISAAPDLLEALEQFNEPCTHQDCPQACRYCMARAAIAKAKGE